MVVPEDPNFMCTGLLTMVLSFGSMNITCPGAFAGFFVGH
jgi:hypothetical protein